MHLKLTESRLPFPSLWLIAPFFLWGTAMVAMKGTLSHTTPLFMASVRLIPAGILILIAAVLMGRISASDALPVSPVPASGDASPIAPPPDRPPTQFPLIARMKQTGLSLLPPSGLAWLWIGLFGLVDGTCFQGFLAEGLQRTGAGLGSVMIDSQPIAVALMARLLFGEQVGLWGWLGLMFGVMGISLLGLPTAWLMQGFSQAGVLDLSLDRAFDLVQQIFQGGQWLMLLAALSMAVGTVLVRYVCRHVDPVLATGWHMILGGLPLLGLSIGLETQQWQQLNWSDWMALSYSTLFGSAIAYGLFFYFASSGSLTSLSSLTFLTPVFALLFGNLFLGEMLESYQWLGVGLTLISIYLINQRDRLLQRFRAKAIDRTTETRSGTETGTETEQLVGD